MLLGAGRGRRSIVCVTWEPEWAWNILDGKLWRGVDGRRQRSDTCVYILSDAWPVVGGSRGCLEVYASATAIVRMASRGKSAA